MCQYWSEDGMPSDWHLVHLGSRAVGGAALVIAEASAVVPEGRITAHDAGIWSDAHAEAWERIARFVADQGAVPAIQIAHAGRKASTAQPWIRHDHDVAVPFNQGGWQPVAPSPLPFRPGSHTPHELSKPEIAAITKAFSAAAIRSLNAGFKWLELHFAHGYLAHSFLTPLANKRTDEYGGSFENRIRFAIETTRAVREVWPDSLPLTVRLSATDWVDGGWTLEESVELSKRLKTEGVDLIDCSSGFGVPGVRYPVGPGWQVSLSQTIRTQANIPTATVGMINDARQADDIIRQGQADIVLLASKMLQDAYWPLHAAQQLQPEQSLRLPPPYDYVVNPSKKGH